MRVTDPTGENNVVATACQAVRPALHVHAANTIGDGGQQDAAEPGGAPDTGRDIG